MPTVQREMDIKTFVRTSLVQIVEGVETAIQDLKAGQTTAKINPVSSNTHYSDPRDVEFDIAVTVSDTKSGGAGGGIKIASISLGGEASKTVESEAISRIRFVVPVAVPSMSGDQYRHEPIDYSEMDRRGF